ncbi:MAG: RDD family protein [Chloroflexota bacterium]
MTQSATPQGPSGGLGPADNRPGQPQQPTTPEPDGPSVPPSGAPAGGSQTSSWTQTLTSTSAVPGPPGFFYADVPNRIIAYIIDLIILTIIGFVLALTAGSLFGGLTAEGTLDSAGGDLNLGAFFVVSIGQLAISLGYFGYFWTRSRGTPGMKLLGLQIGDEADGHSIDWNQALIRWLILGVPSILSTFASFVSSGLGLVLSLVGVVWLIILLYTIAKSPTKQGLHDRYARTILVKAGRRAS